MKTAIYYRVSTKDQNYENQLLELRKFCSKSDYEIVHEYIDFASGSKNEKERTGLTRMFQEAREKKFDLVLVWSLDRLTREGVLQTLSYLERLDTYGILFKSYKEEFLDSTGVFKDVIRSIIATIAKQERLRISERVKAGLERAKKEGRVGGRPRIKSNKIAQIRTLKSSGLSNRKIANKLGISHTVVSKYVP